MAELYGIKKLSFIRNCTQVLSKAFQPFPFLPTVMEGSIPCVLANTCKASLLYWSYFRGCVIYPIVVLIAVLCWLMNLSILSPTSWAIHIFPFEKHLFNSFSLLIGLLILFASMYNRNIILIFPSPQKHQLCQDNFLSSAFKMYTRFCYM